MNETEKKAFEMLSEEEKEQVSGGETIDEQTELNDTQCQALSKKLQKKIGKPLIPYLDPMRVGLAYGAQMPKKLDIKFPKDFPPPASTYPT